MHFISRKYIITAKNSILFYLSLEVHVDVFGVRRLRLVVDILHRRMYDHSMAVYDTIYTEL